jgi:hypothetical protein
MTSFKLNSFAGFAVEGTGVQLPCSQRFGKLKVSIFMEIVHYFSGRNDKMYLQVIRL